MNITVDLPKGLLREAMKVSGKTSESDTVISASTALIQQSEIASIKNYKGKVDLTIPVGQLRSRV